jgi:hypothetical protein
MKSVEQLVEWDLASKREAIAENLPQSHKIWPGSNPGRCTEKTATNRLNNGTAHIVWVTDRVIKRVTNRIKSSIYSRIKSYTATRIRLSFIHHITLIPFIHSERIHDYHDGLQMTEFCAFRHELQGNWLGYTKSMCVQCAVLSGMEVLCSPKKKNSILRLNNTNIDTSTEMVLMRSFSFSFLGWGWNWFSVSHYLAYCTSSGLWMVKSVEQSLKWLAGNTAVLRENLPQRRFVHHNSHMTWPGLVPGSPRWEASDLPPELRHDLFVISNERGCQMPYARVDGRHADLVLSLTTYLTRWHRCYST